jgi:hypothetical protein
MPIQDVRMIFGISRLVLIRQGNSRWWLMASWENISARWSQFLTHFCNSWDSRALKSDGFAHDNSWYEGIIKDGKMIDEIIETGIHI